MSRFGESVSKAADAFVAGNFPDRDKGKAAQGRVDHRDAASMQENGISVESTSNARDLQIALDRDQTQLLTERPTPELGKTPPELQKAAWESNVATNQEGESEEVIKSSFEQVQEARKKTFERFNQPTNEKNINGLIGLQTPGETKISKSDILTSTEVSKFVTLDNPEQNLRWDATGVIVDDLSKNVKQMTEAIYGSDLNTFVDAFINEKATNAEGGPPTAFENLRQSVEESIKNPVSGLTMDPEAYNADTVEALISETIKILLIENPDQATDILDKLAQDSELNLDSIPGFRDTFQKRLIKHTLDSLESNDANKDFFDINGHSDTLRSKQRAKGNRKAIYDKLTASSVTAAFTLQEIPSNRTKSVTVTALDTRSEWTKLKTTGDIKLNPHRSTGVSSNASARKYNPYINSSAFRGEAFTSSKRSIAASLIALSEAMTKNQSISRDLYKVVLENALDNGVNSGSTELSRVTAFAKTSEQLKLLLTGTPSDTDSIATLVEEMEQLANPNSILEITQKELLKNIFAEVASITGSATPPAELTGLDFTALGEELNQSVESGTLSSTLIERLTAISVVLPEAERTAVQSQIRALSNIEIIKAIASEVSEEATTGDKYTQYLAALMNRFVFNDSGTATSATSEQLTQQFMDLMYAKSNEEEALKISIGSFGPMESYVEALIGSGSVEANLTLNGLQSTGTAFTKAHQLLGIVRRGSESSEWFALNGSTDAEISQYIIDNFGVPADSDQLGQVLERFKSVAHGVAPVADYTLSQVIEAARDGSNSQYGRHYTNMMRVMRSYIIHGGDLGETLKAPVEKQVHNFLGSVQSQAHPELGSLEGDALVERNRVLGLEEQRAAVLENYQALNNEKGIKKFFRVLKAAAPRIAKTLMFPTLGLVGAALPGIAAIGTAGMLLGAGMRVFAGYQLIKNGIPQVKAAMESGNKKALRWAIGGFAVKAALYSFLPPSMGQMLAISAGEATSIAAIQTNLLYKEARTVTEAFETYDRVTEQFIDDIDETTDDGDSQLRKLASSLNISVPAGAISDADSLKDNIKAARDTARTDGNMALLQEYSSLIEQYNATEAKAFRDSNIKQKRSTEETQQNLTAWGVGSGLGSLGVKSAKDAIAGGKAEYQENGILGGIWGGIKGFVGLSGLEFGNNNDNQETNAQAEKLAQIDKSLEDNYDQIAEENEFVNNGDDNILAVGENANGDMVALIDDDGDHKGDFYIKLENGPSEGAIPVLSNNVQGLIADDGTAVLSDNPQILKVQLMAFSGDDDVRISPAPEGVDQSIQAIVEIEDRDYVLINKNGVNELHAAKLEYVTTTTNSGGSEGNLGIYVEAQSGTSLNNQWSLVEELYREAAPGMDDQTYYTLTANTINEVGASNLYSHLDRVHNAATITDGDRLSLDAVKEMAPNEFDKFVKLAERNNIEIAQSSDNTTTAGESTKTLTIPNISEKSELSFQPGTGRLVNGIVFASGAGSSHMIFQNGQLIGQVPFAGAATMTQPPNSGGGVAPQADDTSVAVAPEDDTTNITDTDSSGDQSNSTTSILEQLGIAGAVSQVEAPESEVVPTDAVKQEASAAQEMMSDDTSDTFRINNTLWNDPMFFRGLFDGRGNEVFESTVDKIYIYGEGGEVMLDTDEVDIVSIDPGDKLIYKVDGHRMPPVDLHHRDVDLVFKNDPTERVDIEGPNLLQKIQNAAASINSAAQETNKALKDVNQAVNETNDALGETGNIVTDTINTVNDTVNQTVESATETWNRLGEWDRDRIIFNPGVGMGEDYALPVPGTILYAPDNTETTLTHLVLGDNDPIPYNRVTYAGLHEVRYYNEAGEIQTVTNTLDDRTIYGLGEDAATGDRNFIYTFPISRDPATVQDPVTGVMGPKIQVQEVK